MIIEQQKGNHEGKPLTPENRLSQSHSNLKLSRLTFTSVCDYLIILLLLDYKLYGDRTHIWF